MHRDELPIPEPCAARWEEMDGDDRSRLCGLCHKHVHDLSAMTASEAAEQLSRETEPCVRYQVDASGHVLHRGRMAALMAAAVMVSAPALAEPPEEPPPATIRPFHHPVIGEVVVPVVDRPMIMGRIARPGEPSPPVDPIRVTPRLPEPPAGETVIPEVEAALEQQRRRR